MQEAHRPRMQRSAAPPHIISAEPVLIPPVVDGLHVPGENQQKRRQRAKLVDPARLLHLHPTLDPLPEPPLPPPVQIHHHHPRVEVARPPPPLASEHLRTHPRLRPKLLREVFGEVRSAVLGRAYCSRACKLDAPQPLDIINHNQIRI
eukprot:TRINITY_DN42086_c0_g1_i1.p2 TRINITY_DN42086_c0_g1~~TRINITY_DN42086_c0_g1_i1.p2  ORF type:complete len:148 (+),score=19.75 TRINITY_DN42086_c0_g1_i1:593-1036(+)